MSLSSESWDEGPLMPAAPEEGATSTPLGGRAFERRVPDVSPVKGWPSVPFDQKRRLGRRDRAARRIVYSSEEESAIPPEYSRRNLKWRGRDARTYKYVDDNLQVNTVNMEMAQRGEDSGGKFRDKHVVECQNTFRNTIRRAESKGMKVNAAKTAMLCSIGAQSYSARSHISPATGRK